MPKHLSASERGRAMRVRQQNLSLGTQTITFDIQQGTPSHGYSSMAGYPATAELSLGTESKTTSDMVTKNFRKMIQDGKIVNNPFESFCIRDSCSPAGAYERISRRTTGGWSCSSGHPQMTHYTHYWEKGEHLIPSPGFLPLTSEMASMEASVRSAAVTQAHANIDVSEMLALATVAESGKTVQSMIGIYSRLKKILRNARRLRLRELADELSPKELANRWMEVRYAIRPLIYDAYGIAKSFEKNRGYERRTYRGQAESSAQVTDTIVGLSNQYVMYLKADWVRSTTMTASARAGVLCDISVNDITVLGVDQLAETMWELTPLSFVVDWFVNVGDWIAAHSPNFGVTQRASWVTTKYVVNQRADSGTAYTDYTSPAGRTGVSVTSMPSSWYERNETAIRRTVNPAISTFPAVDVRLDTYKLTDMGIMLKKYLA